MPTPGRHTDLIGGVNIIKVGGGGCHGLQIIYLPGGRRWDF